MNKSTYNKRLMGDIIRSWPDVLYFTKYYHEHEGAPLTLRRFKRLHERLLKVNAREPDKAKPRRK